MSASGRYEKNGGTTCRNNISLNSQSEFFSKLNLNRIIVFKTEQKKSI